VSLTLTEMSPSAWWLVRGAELGHWGQWVDRRHEQMCWPHPALGLQPRFRFLSSQNFIPRVELRALPSLTF
jgi:hypothetical protein